ncbi:MAG: protein kinase [Kofleriaceae bacterium]|nr:protein kinase [Kofleriaceae bacterium]
MSGIPAGAGSLLGKRLGKYEILALLALGGTAEIYLARIGGTAGFEKYVVVKCLHDHLADDPDFVKMFLDEARLAAVLDHSNIVQTFELGEYENRYYMVMEFLAGLSLAMVVRRAQERLQGGYIPVPLVLNIAAQSCAGLHYAHERTANGKPLNMVHRDISPQNLVISFEGVVKVVDFGIARAELRETKTKAGTIKGKFAYMSPEQCVANAVDRRTDVFALGVIVHELLTGRRLFKRNSPYETYQAVLECNVEPPSKLNNQLDPALDEIVMKAVQKDKDKRYPTAEAFGDAMLGYLHHRGKGSGGSELGRFFEAHFTQEIEEHGERMRELIAGRDFAGDTGGGWGEEDEKGNQTVDLGAKKSDEESMSLTGGDLEEMRPSDQSLDRFVGRLQTEADATSGEIGEDDEMPADRTRIEMNPLDKLQQLNDQVARNSAQAITPVPTGSVTGGPSPLPAPPTGPLRPSSAVPRAEWPNQPTVVAADAEKPRPELQATAIAGLDPRIAAHRQTQAEMAAQQPPSDAYAMRAHNATQPEQAITGMPPSGPLSASMPSQMPPGPMPSQIPSGPLSGAMQLMDYPVMPGGQRPFSADLAPSGPGPMTGPHRPLYPSGPFDAHAAASLMSPVGEHYPQTDWERAAAQPAKALPPWMLAALFAAALGGALLLTFLIAKIFS